MDMPDTPTLLLILTPRLWLLMPIQDWVMALDYGHGEEDAGSDEGLAEDLDAGLDAVEEEALDSGVIRGGGGKETDFFKLQLKEVNKMPGGDRTGPWGMGPMTGRGLGFCSGYAEPGYMSPGFGYGYGVGRGGIPWGGGRGRAFGGGRGRYWGAQAWGAPPVGPYGYGPYQAGPWGPYGYQQNPEDERAFLEDQLVGLQAQIKSIQDRIEELSQEPKEQE